MKQKNSAFTLLEIIVAIVVFGIVSSISADIFTKIYSAYLSSKSLNEIETKTELALEVIAKRLKNRIPGSIIVSKNPNGTVYEEDFVSLSNADERFQNLEWISYDVDTFIGGWNGVFYKPNWSGLIDLYHPEVNQTTLVSPGSNFNSIDFSHRVVIFDKICPAQNFGLHNPYNHNCSLIVENILSNTKLLLKNNPKKEMVEHYYIAKEAYAIVANGSSLDFNLTLHYDYQPWEGESYSDAKKSLLVERVSKFYIMQTANGAIYIRLCVWAPFVDEEKEDLNVSVCKEKIVY